MEKGNQAIDELKKATGNEKVHILQIDLADLVSIQRAAAEFQRLASVRDARIMAEHYLERRTSFTF
jgi:hypothetical protein